MKLKSCFDENGNFSKPLDPYRCDKDDPVYSILFNENGYAIKTVEVSKLIEKNKWKWNCDAVKYYYSGNIDFGCRENYTAIYAWR